MRLPRDLSGRELIKRLSVLGYRVTRQKGSHIRLTTFLNGEHHITIPDLHWNEIRRDSHQWKPSPSAGCRTSDRLRSIRTGN